MQTGGFQRVVPADLAVVVGVDVDETGGDDAPRRVDLVRCVGLQAVTGPVSTVAAAYLDDAAVLDADVAR